MKKWKTVRVGQELANEIEKEVNENKYPSLSEFVAEAIQMRLQTLAKERVTEYLKRDELTRVPQIQEQVFYTPKHIWVNVTAQGTVRLGVTDYFCRKCHGITFLDLSVEIGQQLSANQPFALAETPGWWYLRDLCCPISGVLTKVNGVVLEDPLVLREDHAQWIVEVEPSDPEFYKESGSLLSSDEYTRLIAVLEDRLQTPSDSELRSIVQAIKQ